MYNLETHNDNLYLSGQTYNGSFAAGELQNIMLIMTRMGYKIDGVNPNLNDVQYDPINNLLYTTGKGKGGNLNPLGEESIQIIQTLR